MKFKKIQTYVDAIKWNGDNLQEILELANSGEYRQNSIDKSITVFVIKGWIKVNLNDWFVKELSNDYLALPESTFFNQYETVVIVDAEPIADTLPLFEMGTEEAVIDVPVVEEVAPVEQLEPVIEPIVEETVTEPVQVVPEVLESAPVENITTEGESI